MRIFSAVLIAVLTANSAGAQTADACMQQLVASTTFKDAAAFLERDYDRFVSELITLTEIPAPPFKEQKRAEAYLEMLRGVGLSDVESDAEGNVMAAFAPWGL